jgi:hypothetical protein
MNIYESICGVMSEIGAIGKDKKNLQQGFMYRGIDDVMNVLQPLFVKHKVFIVPEVLEHIREDRVSKQGSTLIYSICKIKYTFYAEDGSNITAVVVGEGMDSGDKATNKAMAIAMKYACFQAFCIPTEEMVDPDKETHELTKPKQSPPPKQTPPPTPPPQSADVITEAQAKRLFAIAKGNADKVKEVIGKYGYESTKAIKKADYEKIAKEVEI